MWFMLVLLISVRPRSQLLRQPLSWLQSYKVKQLAISATVISHMLRFRMIKFCGIILTRHGIFASSCKYISKPILKQLTGQLAFIVDIAANCACGAVSQFSSPGYIPRCARGLTAAHNLAVSPTAVSIQQRENTRSLRHLQRGRRLAELRSVEEDVEFTYPPGTLRVSEIWTAIEVVPSTALPTPSYPDTTGQSQ